MRPAAFLLTLTPLIFGLAAPVVGQDLAAAAAREKERREKAKKGKAFTNEDLSQPAPKKPSTEASPAASDGRPMDSERLRRLGGGGSGTTSAPVTTPPAKEPACEGDCGEGAAPEAASDEASWRRRAQGMRDAVARAEADVARIQKALDERRSGVSQPLPIDAMRQVPPDPLTQPPGAERLTQDLEAAKAAVVAARQAQADFEEEARKAGALPGWLR